MIYSDSNSEIGLAKMEFISELNPQFPLACYEYSLRNRSDPWHWHSAFELNIVAEGSCKCLIGGKTRILQEGMGVFINSAMLHAILADGTLKGRIKSIVFDKGLVAETGSLISEKYVQPFLNVNNFNGIILRKSIPWQQEIMQRADAVLEACRTEAYGYELTVAALCGQILASIQPWVIEYENELTEGTANKTLFVKPMLLYIWEHYAEPLTLEDIAKAGWISKNECIQCFHQVVGISPIQYVKGYRLQRAAALLLDTEESISQIAAACGFQDGGYFARAFSERYGTTPLSWRRARRNSINSPL